MNIKYPHFGRIDQLYPNPHIVLGHDIWWTLKLDGSNCGIYFDDNGEIKVRSRNQDVAEFYQKVENVPAYEKVVDFMTFHRDEYGSDFVVFAELLNKGRSPTGIKVHDKDEIVIFDMYNGKTEKYVHYPQLSLFCGAFDIPLTPLVVNVMSQRFQNCLSSEIKCLKHLRVKRELLEKCITRCMIHRMKTFCL